MDQLHRLGARYRLERSLASGSVRHALNIRQDVYFQAVPGDVRQRGNVDRDWLALCNSLGKR